MLCAEPREIGAEEISSLYGCIAELSQYHNEVSVNWKGLYPKREYAATLEIFRRQVEAGASRIAVVGEREICGFCKIDVDGTAGKLDYLMVTKAERGKGCGRALMDWAMRCFAASGVTAIEVKVVDGNPAIHLYEKYGFRAEAHLLRRAL